MFDAAQQVDAAAWSGGGRVAAAPPEPAAVANSLAKRAFDLTVALLLILFLAPLLTAVAIAVAVTSKGPVLFRQRRSGLNGRTFQIYKFRSMTVQEDGADLRHATRDDDRVTKVGAFLRRSSIDELPQLFNVLKGDMSLVGPRPHALAHDEVYADEIPEYVERFRARPGLTGLAQVSGFRGEIRRVDCMRKRVGADLAYIEDWSLARDIEILARTVPLVLNDPQAF